MNITGIVVEKIYHIETDEDGFESLVRYSEDEWFVNYSNRKLKIEHPEEIEADLQRLLLLNISTDN